MNVLVDESKCTACGTCLEVCAVEAITINKVACIDSDACILCGACVYECSEGAMSMEGMESPSVEPRQTRPSPAFTNSGESDQIHQESSFADHTEAAGSGVRGIMRGISDFFGPGNGRKQGGFGGGRGKGRGGKGGGGNQKRNWKR